jgi:hypothetical protein
MSNLVLYLVAAMNTWVPMKAQHHERLEHATARYESIARDVAAVALDDSEEPLFEGNDGRVQTAVFLLAIASFESDFRLPVDQGIGRGDHGDSYCLMQIRVGAGTTREGWTGRQLVTDRKLCFRAALHILHGSFNICHTLPIEDRMSAYATGRCLRNVDVVRQRMDRARSWWTAHAPPPDEYFES